MDTYIVRLTMKLAGRLSPLALALTLCTATHPLRAQTPGAQTKPAPVVPEWAQPGSATHVQVAPPADFHRPSKNFDTPIGIFEGQSDIGSALVVGSASYDPGTKQYTINSAGYNVWYTRDEFRYLWRKMSGDVSLAADIQPGRRTDAPVWPPIHLHIDGPFYAGIGFCSHLPDKSDTAVLSNVLLENSAGKVR